VTHTETEATILSVEEDASWKYSIEATIPAFDGDRSYRYLAWSKKQGPPPQVGAVGLATLEPYQRAKFYVTRGDIEAGPVDGSERHYQVTWNMIAFAPGATNGAGASSDAPAGSSGATYLPPPTADERLAKELAKYRREIEGVNDRKAVTDVLALVEPGTYTLDGLIEDAEKLAAWYNARVAARCESPVVQAAQAAGAVVVEVDDEPQDGPPQLKNKADLAEWVKGQGWSKDQISTALQDAGFASSSAYLEESGNTVPGLASVLFERLG
jgi:hypothetical protein